MKIYNIMFYPLAKPGLILRDFYLKFISVKEAILFAEENKRLDEGYKIKED